MMVRHWSLWLMLFVVVAGCRPSGAVAVYPVRGRVLLGDQPVAGAQVVLHPDQPLPPTVPQPTAITQDDGTFRLTTFGDYDGAPVGKYRVTVEWRDWRMIGEEKSRQGRVLLPGRYLQPKNSGLSCEIQPQENVLADFRVQPR